MYIPTVPDAIELYVGLSSQRDGDHGQYDSIHVDIPKFLSNIQDRRGGRVPLYLVGHSWGGVLLNALLIKVSMCVRE